MDIEGVYVPVVTPFHSSHDVDFGTLDKVIEHVVGAGVRGVVACGTTGEYYALTHDERVQVMARIAEAVGSRAHLVAGCNAGSTREAIALAGKAKEQGYQAIMLAAPPTSLPSQRELAAHFAAVASGSGLPVILYNYPARAGVEIGEECLDLLADDANVVAIKESSSDFSRFLWMRRKYRDAYTIMCGSDDQAVDYFAWGVRSWLAGTANALPRHHVVVQELANRGDIARARQLFDAMLPWIQACESGSYNQKAKLALKLQGIDCGDVRQPLLPMSEDAAAAHRRVTEAALGIELPSLGA